MRCSGEETSENCYAWDGKKRPCSEYYRGRCALATCRIPITERGPGAGGQLKLQRLPCMHLSGRSPGSAAPLQSWTPVAFCPLPILPHGTERWAALDCAPFPQRRGSDTHLLLPIVMGSVLPQKSSLWSAERLHCVRGRQSWAGTRSQAVERYRLREGEGTGSHFPHAPAHRRRLSVRCHWWGSRSPRRQVPGTVFRLFSSEVTGCLHLLGRPPPHPQACSRVAYAPYDTLIKTSREAELLLPSQTGICLLLAQWHFKKDHT